MINISDHRLSVDEVQQFETEGYLLLRGVLPRQPLARVQEVFEAAVEQQANEWFAEGKISDKAEELPFETRYAKLREQLPAEYSNSWRRIIVSRAVYEMWQQPELVGVLRALIGDELYAHDTWNGRPRPPKQSVATIDWHQDAHYYRRFEPTDQPLISVWMPLVPVTAETGCLQVFPGSHKRGLLPAVRLERNGLIGVADEDVADMTPVTCEMEPGDALFFGALTLHRALENVSDIVRWSLDIRFCDATNEPAVSKAGKGYYCYSAADASRVQSFEEWAAQYDYEGEF